MSEEKNEIARFYRVFFHSLYSNSHIHKTPQKHIDSSYFIFYMRETIEILGVEKILGIVL